MGTQKLIENNEFWKILQAIDGLSEPIKLSEFCHYLEGDISEFKVIEAISFLEGLSYPISCSGNGKNKTIKIEAKRPRIQFNMSLCEWFAFQAHFPLFEGNRDKEVFKLLANKLTNVERRYPEYDLYNVIENEQHQESFKNCLASNQEEVLNMIAKAKIEKDLILCICAADKNVEIFLHRLVYIDGVLSLVGEDTNDRCLSCVDFHEVKSIKVIKDHSYSANFARAEVDDFILAIRSITGNEERLVLRVFRPENIDLKPEYHFLGNPYVTTNTEGEFIWAASVEVSDELFAWLANLKDEVEIIDPSYVRDEFEQYLESYEQETVQCPLKKAS